MALCDMFSDESNKLKTYTYVGKKNLKKYKFLSGPIHFKIYIYIYIYNTIISSASKLVTNLFLKTNMRRGQLAS